MPDHDPAFDDAIREIANLLATDYLRLRFQDRIVSEPHGIYSSIMAARSLPIPGMFCGFPAAAEDVCNFRVDHGPSRSLQEGCSALREGTPAIAL